MAITADKVLAGLRRGPLREPAHAWLYEVRNGTGAVRRERYADALVVSCWPSRGIWLAGVEVKVSRRDWLRELDEPGKSAEIQRFCDYWWIAAPPEIVRINEIPETWGLYEVFDGKVKAVKEAPRQKPAPYTSSFVASMLRNVAEQQNAAVLRGRQEAQELLAVEQKLVSDQALEHHGMLQRLEALQRENGYLKSDIERLKQIKADFEKGAGFPVDWHNPKRCGELYRVVTTMGRSNDLLRRLQDASSAINDASVAVENLQKIEDIEDSSGNSPQKSKE